MTRVMSRLFSRADIPVKFTEGFNPHPYMVFGVPLPVGVSGLNEMIDVKFSSDMAYDEVLERLNKNAPEGFVFKKVYEADTEFSDISCALYSIKTDYKTAGLFDRFLESDQITVEKKTKKGFAEYDLKQEMSLDKKDSNSDYTEYFITLPCGQNKNISPLLLLQAFEKTVDFTPFFEAVRVSVY